MSAHFVGLISGTSMDAVDAVLVDLPVEGAPRCIAALSHPIPPELHARLKKLADPQCHAGLDELGEADVLTGELFAEAALAVIRDGGLEPGQVQAIGSHGQTVRHRPQANPPFTLQIGNPQRIAQRTGVTTVADFRQRDMAAGGQGAPLVPAFHRAIFWTRDEDRVVVNIGGIANITYLPANGPVTGFDTGPGNTLMDLWIRRHQDRPFDKAGQWARQGQVAETLLNSLLSEPYLGEAPPKSTGPEYFSALWLDQRLARYKQISHADVQRTLLEYTAQSIADAIHRHARNSAQVLICGGGARNDYLTERLALLMPERRVSDTGAFGVEPDWVEAMAFAWLARETLAGRPGNVREVTGAREDVILGGIFPGRDKRQDPRDK